MTAADPFNLDDVLDKYTKKPSETAKPELALLYSRPGGGKTYLAATISEVPGVNRTLILDTEGSTSGTLSDFDDDKVQIIDCRRDTPIASFQFLNTILEKLFDSKNKHSYDAVIVDTFDVAQDWALAYFESTTPKNDGFAKWAGVKEWSLSTAASLKRMAPYAVLVIHDKTEKDADGANVIGLNLLGSARDLLPGIPDIVAYLKRVLENDREVTLGYFASEGNKVTKNRFKFPPVVRDPSFPKLFQYIEDQRKAKEASK